jgi:hypothetical protein
MPLDARFDFTNHARDAAVRRHAAGRRNMDELPKEFQPS